MSRRKALSSAAKIGAGVAVGAIVAGAGAYYVGSSGAKASTSTATQTITTSSSGLPVVPLTYWTLTEAPQNIPIYNQWVDEYAAVTPGFSVANDWTFVNYPDENTTYLPKLEAGVQNPSTLPDFALSWPDVAVPLGEEGVFLDVTDFINDYVPGGINAWFANGQVVKNGADVKTGDIYVCPNFFNVDLLYVNNTILTNANQTTPTTWDEFDAVCKAVHNPPDVYAFDAQWLSSCGGDFDFGAVLPTFGAHALNQDLQVTFNSPETLAALEYWMGLYNTYAPPGKETANGVTVATQFASYNPSGTGNIAMMFGTNFRFAQQIGAVSSALAYTDAIPTPSGGGTIAPNGGPGGNLSFYGYCLCNGAKSRNELAQAESMMAWFLEPQNQLDLFTQGHYMITREDIWQNYQSEMAAADPTGKYVALLGSVRTAAATAKSWPEEYGVGPWATDFVQAVDTMLQSALLGQSSPQDAIATATSAMVASMEKNGYSQTLSSSS